MVYKNNFVASIQVNGDTLREHKDTVELPFQSEYSIYLKNLDNRKCKVFIRIDGTDITSNGLVIDKYSSVNLERFLDTDRKFKFIKKTEDIERFRGNKPEDSLIEIRYGFELSPMPIMWNNHQYPHIIRNPTLYGSSSYSNSGGFTTEGTQSNQKFKTVSDFSIENTSTIVFQLIGKSTPKTIKSKKQCSSCGKLWKSKFAYCPNDGTFLR